MCLQIEELEQARRLGDKSDVDEMIDNARREKDYLECEVANLQVRIRVGRISIIEV